MMAVGGGRARARGGGGQRTPWQPAALPLYCSLTDAAAPAAGAASTDLRHGQAPCMQRPPDQFLFDLIREQRVRHTAVAVGAAHSARPGLWCGG